MNDGETPPRRRGPAGWTREEIDAWVRGDGEWRASERTRHYIEVSRRELVRLCPEADNYAALAKRITDETRRVVPIRGLATKTDEELRALVADQVAALWRQRLSEPVEGEATA